MSKYAIVNQKIKRFKSAKMAKLYGNGVYYQTKKECERELDHMIQLRKEFDKRQHKLLVEEMNHHDHLKNEKSITTIMREQKVSEERTEPFSQFDLLDEDQQEKILDEMHHNYMYMRDSVISELKYKILSIQQEFVFADSFEVIHNETKELKMKNRQLQRIAINLVVKDTVRRVKNQFLSHPTLLLTTKDMRSFVKADTSSSFKLQIIERVVKILKLKEIDFAPRTEDRSTKQYFGAHLITKTFP